MRLRVSVRGLMLLVLWAGLLSFAVVVARRQPLAWPWRPARPGYRVRLPLHVHGPGELYVNSWDLFRGRPGRLRWLRPDGTWVDFPSVP